MKPFLFFLLACFCIDTVAAQNDACSSAYMAWDEGTEFDYTFYDKKGKADNVSTQHIELIEDVPEGFAAQIHYKLADKNKEQLSKGHYKIVCKGDHVLMDLSNMLDPRVFESLGELEVEIANDQMDLPNQLVVGQMLKDGGMTVKASTEGMTLINMRMRIYDRKVEAMEKVTTPAGTFDCARITQQIEMKTIIKSTSKSIAWYAKGVGMVKTENFDKKGNLEGSSMLTRFKK
jgi:hypothetical protein